jgi:ABC-2 type transport system permease protein
MNEVAIKRANIGPNLWRVNLVGFWTIVRKETRRVVRIWIQTIVPPAITMTLYFIIFGSLVGGRIGSMDGVPYMTFIAPGLIIMGMIQNSFANASFSLLAGKMQGTIVDFLMPPLSTGEVMAALIGAAVTRACLVGFAVWIAMLVWPGGWGAGWPGGRYGDRDRRKSGPDAAAPA